MSGNFSTQVENPFMFGKFPNVSSQEETKPEEINLFSQGQTQLQKQEEAFVGNSENIEPQGKKKRKLNNAQEAPGIQVNGVSPVSTQVKKSKSEGNIVE